LYTTNCSPIPIVQQTYEECVQQTCREWLEKLESQHQKKQPIDILLYSTLIASDVGGRAGFAKNFGGVKGGTETRMLQLLDLSTSVIGQVGLLPWPLALGAQLDISPEKKEFEALAAQLVNEAEHEVSKLQVYSSSPQEEKTSDRLTQKSPKTCLLSGLLQDYASGRPVSYHDRNELVCDAQVILSAST
jgi:hypothetical protein